MNGKKNRNQEKPFVLKVGESEVKSLKKLVAAIGLGTAISFFLGIGIVYYSSVKLASSSIKVAALGVMLFQAVCACLAGQICVRVFLDPFRNIGMIVDESNELYQCLFLDKDDFLSALHKYDKRIELLEIISNAVSIKDNGKRLLRYGVYFDLCYAVTIVFLFAFTTQLANVIGFAVICVCMAYLRRVVPRRYQDAVKCKFNVAVSCMLDCLEAENVGNATMAGKKGNVLKTTKTTPKGKE